MFNGATLIGTDLTDARLSGTSWDGATLQGLVLDRSGLGDATGLTDAMLASALGVPLEQMPAALSAHAVVLERDMTQAWTDACAGRPIGAAVAGWSTPAQILYPPDRRVTGVPARQPAAARFADVVACFDLDAQAIEKVTSCGTYSSMGGFDVEVFLVVGTLEVRLVDAATAADLATFSITSALPEGCPANVFDATVGGVGLDVWSTSPTIEIDAQVDALAARG